VIYTYAARLVRVTDGDTVRLDLDLGFYQWRLDQPYRLLRIDAPELSTVAGKLTKSRLELWLGSPGVTLVASTQKSDSFGRWLIELLANNTNVSDWLVREGLATYRTFS
jgi:endonuclease YncB( thermonuclease family)